MSGQEAQDEGSWMDSMLQDMVQSACEPANVQIQLKRIKSVAKRGDAQVEVVFSAVWEALRSQSSMMRLAALHVCDELFLRSKHFRRLLMDNKFPIFVEQVVAPGKSLPAPKDAAKTLLEKALECIQQWTQRFSRHHVELTIAHTYLRDIGLIQDEGTSQGRGEAQPASNGAAEAHPPTNQPPADPEARERVQKLIADISRASMPARVCMQCVAALLESLGHTVPKHLSQTADMPMPREGSTAAQPVTPGSPLAQDPQGAEAGSAGDGGAAPQPGGGEDLEFEFEDVDWQERGAGGAAVADTMAVAAPHEVGAQAHKRRLPRRIRAALVTALRKGQEAMQAVHMPEVAALRAAVAASGADEGALADAVASGGAMAAALPAAWRAVALEQLQVAEALPALQADGREVLGLLASAPELAQEDAEADPVATGAGSSGPRKRVLRGRNERDWPDLPPQKIPATVRARDPAAANLHDAYTIPAGPPARVAMPPRGPPPRPVSPAGLRAAPSGPSDAGGPPGHAAQPSADAGKKPTMSKEAIQRLAAKAPVLPPGDYLKLWDSYEAQMEFVQQHMTQGQVYSHWGRVDDDVQLDRAHIEARLAQRAVFHDSLADAGPRPRAAAAAAAAAAAERTRVDVGSGSGSGPGPQTAAEFRAAARAHNLGVLAEAGVREVGTIDAGAGGGAQRGKKRGRGSEGGRAKLRGVMRKMSRGSRR